MHSYKFLENVLRFFKGISGYPEVLENVILSEFFSEGQLRLMRSCDLFKNLTSQNIRLCIEFQIVE